MPTQASGPETGAARKAPCPQCKEIKAKRYAAVRHGDKRTAEAMATTMGLHQRASHA